MLLARHLILCLTLALAVYTAGASEAPVTWRLPIGAPDLQVSTGTVTAAETGPPQARWEAALTPDQPEATLTLPTRPAAGDDMLVFLSAEVQPPQPLTLQWEQDAGQPLQEEVIAPGEDLISRQRSFLLAAPDGRPLTLRVRVSPAPPAASVTVRITRLQCFRFSPRHRADAWLVMGASLTNDSFQDYDRFWRMVRARYPEADPLQVHFARGGWIVGNLLRRAPEMLRRHPYARNVILDIGGNEVTRGRPYPGGAEELRSQLRELLMLLKQDGRRVFLTRLSYRAYPTEPRVPPEENGSLPYNEQIVDPLIREFCPELVDPATGLGRMDPYAFFRAHPEKLAEDGVHHTPEGQEDWVRLWLEAVGPLIYGRPAAPLPTGDAN